MPVLRIPIGGTLPPGRYYVDAWDNWAATFQAWVAKNTPAARVTSTQTTKGALGSPDMFFFVFETTEPLVWDGPNFPNVIPTGQVVTSTSDVYQVPTVSDPFDALYKSLTGLPSWAPWVGGAAAALLIGYWMAAVRQKSR